MSNKDDRLSFISKTENKYSLRKVKSKFAFTFAFAYKTYDTLIDERQSTDFETE